MSPLCFSMSPISVFSLTLPDSESIVLGPTWNTSGPDSSASILVDLDLLSSGWPGVFEFQLGDHSA